MQTTIYTEYTPQNKITGLLSIPHAGEFFPPEFLPYLTTNQTALAKDVDFAVDQLIDIEQIVKANIMVIVAKVHRTCIDLNRPADTACLNWKENTQGEQLVIQEPTIAEQQDLLSKYYAPYYQRLTSTIEEASNPRFPVIDLHSMPSRPTAHHLKLNPHQSSQRPDVCVSDLKGKSCSATYIDGVIHFLNSNGLDAQKNNPYFGGYLTQYMAPLACENIQIELNRHLYMDEIQRTLITEKVAKLKPVLTQLILNTLGH